ncbi:hemin uptake protein HemP [Nitrosomonas sp.]|uniref:hemin uptake protein HemP n=1 Tax=Nitrosomonas sp. TaxID=42353 RepID=UPI0025FCED43|nr:hemin uptake protein HemP [Nitrosomonas sp.]
MNLIDTSCHKEYGSGDESVLQLASFPIKLISSEDLFGNSNQILIQHQGEQYHLRLTRNNKLILTK